MGQHIGELQLDLALAREPRLGPRLARRIVAGAAAPIIRTVFARDEEAEAPAPAATKPVAQTGSAVLGRRRGIVKDIRDYLQRAERPVVAGAIARGCKLTTTQVLSNIAHLSDVGRVGTRTYYAYFIVCGKADPAPGKSKPIRKGKR